MAKLSKSIKEETTYILLWVLILSALMESVFLIIKQWDYTVLLGNLLGGATAVLNFFLLGITIQKVVNKAQDKVKGAMRFSQAYRLFAIAVVIVIGVFVPVFNMWAVIIPLLFPRIAIMFRPLFNNKMSSKYEPHSSESIYEKEEDNINEE